MKETQEVTERDTEVVSRIRARLVAQLGEDRFELWFGSGSALHWTGDSLMIVVDTAFRVDRLRKRLMKEIERVLRQEMGGDVRVTFGVDSSLNRPALPAAKGPIRVRQSSHSNAPSTVARAVESRGSDGWTRRSERSRRFSHLETLVPGDCNRMALGAANLVVDGPGQINPLFIHGPSGVGKTHLLEGIWNRVRQRGGRRIIYLTAEQFTTYFLQALRGSGLPSFRQKYRAVDLLILDDVQFFAGKQATITELLHTLDALLRDSRQVVLAADRPPAELTMLGAELPARFSGGLVCTMSPLDTETRRAMLELLARRRELSLEAVALDRIAERTPGDARQLIGVLNRLWATSLTFERRLTLSLIDEVLDELFPTAGGMIKLDDIQRVVCDEFGLDPALLRSEKRSRSVSHPRMLAMWLARKHTHAALTEIGEFFGRRSHSTVLSAQHKVEGWVSNGQQLQCDRASCDVRSLLSRLERSLRA
jgi:chromosomal replication initiator protein